MHLTWNASDPAPAPLEPIAPTAGMRLLREEMDRMLDEFLGGRLAMREGEIEREQGWFPPLDIEETETHLVVRAEFPGVDPADVHVTLSGHRLVLSGHKQDSVYRSEGTLRHAERRFGSFKRVVDLPGGIDPDSVAAEHDNGIVTITIARQPSARPRAVPILHAGNGTKAPSVATTSP